MAVKFTDNSGRIKSIADDVATAWLTKWGNTVASRASDTVQLDGEAGVELSRSYRATKRQKDHVKAGSPLEAALWEEWGTGEHAVKEPHRRGWWVYKDGYEGGGGKQLTERQAKAMAAGDPTVHATDGREPSYTLENAFKKTMPQAEPDLQRMLNERLGK